MEEIKAAAEIAKGVDPNTLTSLPNWLLVSLVSAGYAVAHLVGALVRLVNKLLDRPGSAHGAGSASTMVTAQAAEERRHVTTDACDNCQENWKKQIEDLDKKYTVLDSRVFELLRDRKPE